MTGAAWRAATDMGAAAILCISGSGFTVRSIARFRPAMPLLGFSPNERTVRQLTMSWGTTPLHAPVTVDSLETMIHLVERARDQGYVRSGDIVAVLAGAGTNQNSRATDLLRLIRVP
jgi:pyruvate kinase